MCQNGSKIICFDIYRSGNTFHFIDNYLMFQTKLKNLPNMFFNE